MVASSGDGKGVPEPAQSRAGRPSRGGGRGREREPPPPPELTAGTEMQVGPEPEPPSPSPPFLSATRLAPPRSPGWERAWGPPRQGGARRGECRRRGGPQETAAPGNGWVEGVRGVGSGRWAAAGPEVRARSGACTRHHPPFGEYQN